MKGYQKVVLVKGSAVVVGVVAEVVVIVGTVEKQVYTIY